VIRQLLTAAGQKNLPGGYVNDDHHGVEAASSNDPTRSPETYVGYARAQNRAGGSITYRFRGRDLHLVLGPGGDGKPVRFRVTIDGKPPGADHGMDTDAT